MCALCSVLSDCATPWSAACQTALSMEVSKQEYWSGLPFLLSRQEAQQNRQNPCPQRSYVLITNSSLVYNCAPFMDDLNYEWDLACVMFSTLYLEAVIRALLFLTREKEEEVFYNCTKPGI